MDDAEPVGHQAGVQRVLEQLEVALSLDLERATRLRELLDLGEELLLGDPDLVVQLVDVISGQLFRGPPGGALEIFLL